MNNPQNDLIFALDIGTRSVIGIVGRMENDMFHILHMVREEHTKRAMLDGQIEDIDQVAKVTMSVKLRLEELTECTLTKVCVAAAGRSLRMERATALVELSQVQVVTDELISQLEAVAVVEAEEKLIEHDKDQRYFLVGYTVAQYALDRYPMTTIKGHRGQRLEADIVATFLPSQVVEGLYSVVQLAGLEVASLTLEPIAALNAVIPQDLHLLNLVLVDIGAGTSDIAVCRDGSVVGYTMATTAGDEITEAMMKHFLVDFNTAEQMKVQLHSESQKFVDVLGADQTVSGQQIRDSIAAPLKVLAKEIAKQILAMNGCAPAAVFLAGGGSKLEGLSQLIAEYLEIDPRYVAIGGNNFKRTTFYDQGDIADPEYATPLGIAVSAGFGLINDSYHITLNGKEAKLFRSGVLTIMDVLMMNGYSAAALIGRTGKNLAVMVNGNKKIIRGKPSIPGILRLNGEQAAAATVVRAADDIYFVPAIDGVSAEATVGDLLGDYSGDAYLNGRLVDREISLTNGDAITTDDYNIQPVSKQWVRPLTQSELEQSESEFEESDEELEEREESHSVESPAEDQDPPNLVEIPLAPPLTVLPVTEDQVYDNLGTTQTTPEPVMPTPEPVVPTPETVAPAPEEEPYYPTAQGEVAKFANGAKKESLEEILKEFLQVAKETESGPPAQEMEKVPYPPVSEQPVLQEIKSVEYEEVRENVGQAEIAQPHEEAAKPSIGREAPIFLNGVPLELEPKPDGSAYHLMDLLLHTKIDFCNVSAPILMKVNGEDSYFVQELKPGDQVIIEEQMS